MSFKKLIVIFSSILLLVLASKLSAVNPNPSATVSVTPGTSSQLTVVPGHTGNNWVYSYTIYDGGSVIDTLPIVVCVTEQNDNAWVSFDIGFSSGGGNLSSTQVTAPGDLTFSYVSSTALPGCQTAYMEVSTGTLSLSNPTVSQTFNRNYNVSATNKNPNNMSVGAGGDTPNVKVQVTVLPQTSHISCFITDSDGNFLTTCTGEAVNDSGSTAGRFGIVVNNRKNIQVATNPGQFYYNVLWENTTGSPQTVSVSFARNGVDPQGAQAIHAMAFAPPFSGISADDFDALNEGLPGGSNDLIQNITVPDGWTLWVDYHLEWSGIGTSASGIGASCSLANKPWAVQATVSGAGITSETCTAGAIGYAK